MHPGTNIDCFKRRAVYPAGHNYRSLRAVVWIFLLLIFLPFTLRAQIDLRAELDTTSILIGDQVGLTLTVVQEPGVEIQSIDWSVLEKKDSLEIVRPGQLDTIPGGERMLLEQSVVLQAFEAGRFTIPSIPVNYRYEGRNAQAGTNSLPLEVRTFPVEGDTASLAPIKTIIEEPLKFQDILPYLLLVILGALITLLIVWFLLRKKGEELPPEPEIQRPAHEIALEKLEDLQSRRLWERDDLKPFYSELTYILREYLENRYQIRALESTTDETIAQLKQAGLSSDWRGKLRQLLQSADLVKFAKARPPASQHEEVLQRTKTFVEETRQLPPTEEAEEGTENVIVDKNPENRE